MAGPGPGRHSRPIEVDDTSMGEKNPGKRAWRFGERFDSDCCLTRRQANWPGSACESAG